ncbi:hypothetical protein I215_15603 [Galbibacter marinus]|uniref:Uncharacterized protein n=1 Tax=Galbibacter marinus TaxID=555500 RepID=K2PZ10_9FLAO|nr:hypothetical protein [Galbibacter marinus]EKF53821.1 hypothetical protein I215_15603 [Galbibacter marinus]
MAGIERKKMFLPGEVSAATSWHSGEVSSGHSSTICWKGTKDQTKMVLNALWSMMLLMVVT